MGMEVIGGSLKHGMHFDAPREFYNPNTDLANCAIEIGVASARFMCEPSNRPSWCAATLAAQDIDEATFQATLRAFADGLMRTLYNPELNIEQEMGEAGFDRMPAGARTVILARFGQECLNRAIAAMRDRHLTGIIAANEVSAERFVQQVHDSLAKMKV